MKNFKRMLSAILVVVMLVSLFPVSVFAEEEQPQQEQTENSTENETVAVTSIPTVSASSENESTDGESGDYYAVTDANGSTAYFSDFATALANCAEDGEIDIMADISTLDIELYDEDDDGKYYSGWIIDKSITLDLNGHTVAFTNPDINYDVINSDGYDISVISTGESGQIKFAASDAFSMGTIINGNIVSVENTIIDGEQKVLGGIIAKEGVAATNITINGCMLAISTRGILNLNNCAVCAGVIIQAVGRTDINLSRVSFTLDNTFADMIGDMGCHILCSDDITNVFVGENCTFKDSTASNSQLLVKFREDADLSLYYPIDDVNHSFKASVIERDTNELASANLTSFATDQYLIYSSVEFSAKIGSIYYKSFYDAFCAAENMDNAEIVLLRDEEETFEATSGFFVIPAGKDITLDLNGHILKYTYYGSATGYIDSLFANYGTFTITDGSTEKNGKIIYGSGSPTELACIVNMGTLNVESGAIEYNAIYQGASFTYGYGIISTNGNIISLKVPNHPELSDSRYIGSAISSLSISGTAESDRPIICCSYGENDTLNLNIEHNNSQISDIYIYSYDRSTVEISILEEAKIGYIDCAADNSTINITLNAGEVGTFKTCANNSSNITMTIPESNSELRLENLHMTSDESSTTVTQKSMNSIVGDINLNVYSNGNIDYNVSAGTFGSFDINEDDSTNNKVVVNLNDCMVESEYSTVFDVTLDLEGNKIDASDFGNYDFSTDQIAMLNEFVERSISVSMKEVVIHGTGSLSNCMIFEDINNVTTDGGIAIFDGIHYEMEIDQYNNHTRNIINSLSYTGTIFEAEDVFSRDENTYTLNGNAYVGYIKEPVLTIAEGENVTIDLNGYTLEGLTSDTDGCPLIINKGTALLIDSSKDKTGKIIFKTNSSEGAVESIDSLTVTSGKFECLGSCVVVKGGELNIDGADAVFYSAESEPIVSRTGSSASDISVTNGNLKSTCNIFNLVNTSGNTLNISGGNFGSFRKIEKKNYFYYASNELVTGNNYTVNVTGGLFYYVNVGSGNYPEGYEIFMPRVEEVLENKMDYSLADNYDSSVFDWVSNCGNKQAAFVDVYEGRAPKIQVIRRTNETIAELRDSENNLIGAYTSLSNAVHEANVNYPGATITLVNDVDKGRDALDIITIINSMTIDLNGHKLYRVNFYIDQQNNSIMPEVTIKNGYIYSVTASNTDTVMRIKGDCYVTLDHLELETDFEFCMSSKNNNNPVIIKNCAFNNSLIIEDAGRLGYSQEEVQAILGDVYKAIQYVKSVVILGEAIVTGSSFSQGIYASSLQMDQFDINQYTAIDNKAYSFIKCDDDAKEAIIEYLSKNGCGNEICDSIRGWSSELLKRNIVAQFLSAKVQTKNDKLIFSVKPCILIGGLGLEAEVPNANLNGEIEFTLPIPESIAEKYKRVYVSHISDDEDKELEADGTGVYTISKIIYDENTEDERTEYFITITVNSFSDFEVIPYDDTITTECSATLNLGDSIDVYMYLKELSSEDSISNYKVSVTYKGTTTEKTDFELVNDKYRLVLASCNAMEVFENINVVVYRETEIFKEFDYSVYDYCNNMISRYSDNSEKTELVELCRSVLDYGTYAKNYFSYTETTPVSGTWTAREETVSGTSVEGTAAVKTGSCTGISAVAATLSLEAKTSVNFKFTLDGSSKDDYTFELSCTDESGNAKDLGSIEGVCELIENGARLKYTVKGISSINLGDVYTLTVKYKDSTEDSMTISYSPMTYAMNKQNSDGTIGILSKALYRYKNSAVAYFSVS